MAIGWAWQLHGRIGDFPLVLGGFQNGLPTIRPIMDMKNENTMRGFGLAHIISGFCLLRRVRVKRNAAVGAFVVGDEYNSSGAREHFFTVIIIAEL